MKCIFVFYELSLFCLGTVVTEQNHVPVANAQYITDTTNCTIYMQSRENNISFISVYVYITQYYSLLYCFCHLLLPRTVYPVGHVVFIGIPSCDDQRPLNCCISCCPVGNNNYRTYGCMRMRVAGLDEKQTTHRYCVLPKIKNKIKYFDPFCIFTVSIYIQNPLHRIRFTTPYMH